MIEREDALAARPRRQPAIRTDPVVPPRRLISRRIAELARLIRISSQEHYRREVGLRGLELQIVLELGSRGPRRRCELAEALASDRSWIGRATKQLAKLGIIVSSSPRGLIALSAVGRGVFDQFSALAASCERQILRGIAQADIDAASHALGLLRDAAAVPEPGHEGLWNEEALPARVVRTARALARVARSANAAICPLSSLEVTTLLRVHEGQPITLTRLTAQLHRDKGQLSRIVGTLTTAGLVLSSPTGRNKKLVASARGERLCGRILAQAARQDTLYRGLLAGELERCLERVLEQLAGNAARLQERSASGNAGLTLH